MKARLLAIEYALYHQGHLCGMVISSRMSGVLAYNAYAKAQAQWPNDLGAARVEGVIAQGS